jgi:hypothetical protein
VAGLAALREARQSGETIDEPVVAVLTSTGLKELPAKELPAMSTDGSAAAPSLDRLIVSLNET